MYRAYELAAEKCPYPLHLGVTEAGTENMGVIKSAAGIGGLLLRGIGNTIRISLTDDPVKEVEAGIKLLKAIGLRKGGIKLVSCPTCGRTRIDLVSMVNEAEKRLAAERAASERAAAEQARLATQQQQQQAQGVANAQAEAARLEKLAQEQSKRDAELAQKQAIKVEREKRAAKWKEASLKGYRSYARSYRSRQ